MSSDHRVQRDTNWYGLVAGLVLALGLAGCDQGEQAASDQTEDQQAAQPAAPQPPAAGPQRPQFEITKISDDGLYRYRNGGHFGTFLVTDEGIILADVTGPEAGEWLKNEFATRFGVPVRYVVYSHHHFDHASGGDVFADTAEFIGHENMLPHFEAPAPDAPLLPDLAWMDTDGDGRIAPDEARLGVAPRFTIFDADGDGYIEGPESVTAQVTDVRPPEITYSDRHTLTLGGKTVELVHPGYANHSDDMTVVFYPEQRVAFGVDFIGIRNVGGGAFGSRSIDEWVNSLRAVEALDFDIIIPGHGTMGTKADITAMRSLFEDVRDAVAEGIAVGSTSEELQAGIWLADYAYFEDLEERLPSLIAQAYRQLSTQ